MSTRAPLWLFGLVASTAIAVLNFNTRRECWDSLAKLEYAQWVDGEVYSMASWRFWDDMYVGISRYLDWNYGPNGRPAHPDEEIAGFLPSPFVVESLSLAHSAVAFYLIASLLLVALGLYAFPGRDRSARGFVVRTVAASLGFAVCCLCRGGTLLMAPAFGAALLLLSWAHAALRSKEELRRRLEHRLSLVLTLAAATLALPALMTTAAGMETETFVLVHFLSFGFLAQAAADGGSRHAGP
jgi:hypothetical protein